MTLIAKIITLNPLQDQKIALEFSRMLSKAGLAPEMIGTVEPLTQKYTEQDFMKMWMEADESYEDIEIDQMIGTAGGMLGKITSPSFLFIVDWMKCKQKLNLNYVTFFFPEETFLTHRDIIINAFKETIVLIDGIYGYISHEVPAERQHLPGTLETRLPGVFWCNYYSKSYMDYFGYEKMMAFPWEKLEEWHDDGMLAYLAAEPSGELLHSEQLEDLAKQHLGYAALTDIMTKQSDAYVMTKS